MCEFQVRFEDRVTPKSPFSLPDIIVHTVSAVQPDGLSAKYPVKTNATYSCHPVNNNKCHKMTASPNVYLKLIYQTRKDGQKYTV